MRRSVFLGWQSLLCILTVGVTCLHGQQTRPVAYVLAVTGNWQLEGQQGAVNAGQPLDAGSRLSTGWYNYDNSITLVHYDDLSRTRIACENSSKNPCRNPVVVSGGDEAPTNQFKTLLSAAVSVLFDKPPAVATHYAVTLSRGKYVVIEKEDVVLLDGEKGFSLTGEIPALPAGTYTVDAKSNDGKTSPLSEKIATLADGSWQTLRIPVPGLYMISILDPDGERRADLLVLFVSGSRYSAARQVFDSVKNRTSKWEGTNSQADEHLFLRAILLAMSQSS
jgi:hypothetical protein